MYLKLKISMIMSFHPLISHPLIQEKDGLILFDLSWNYMIL